MQSCEARSAGTFGVPRRFQIDGRRHQHSLQRYEPARAETGIAEFAETNGDIGAFRHQILPRIGNRHLEAQQRMRGEKFRQPRNDLARAIDHWQREADDAAQWIEAARRVFGVLDFGEDLARPIQEQRARIGDGDAARRAQQQRDAEPGFEFADDARNRRLRQAEFARGARKVAALGGADKNRQFLKPITHL